MSDTLKDLHQILLERKQADPESSYVAKLYDDGLNKILKKVGEEASELIIAAKDGNKQEIVYETADLWFHTLVMLADFDLGPEDILKELQRRFDVSGLTEKTSRKSSLQ